MMPLALLCGGVKGVSKNLIGGCWPRFYKPLDGGVACSLIRLGGRLLCLSPSPPLLCANWFGLVPFPHLLTYRYWLPNVFLDLYLRIYHLHPYSLSHFLLLA